MELSTAEITKLASLARLTLTADETARYQRDLGAILAHVERLQGYIAGKDVVVDRRVVTDMAELRADEPGQPCTPEQRDELLARTRGVRDHKVVVPGVFEQGKR